MILKSVILNAAKEWGRKAPLLAVLCLTSALSACEKIFDDQSACLQGVALRFVYDYHMEPNANAFPANVDCLDVLVFDADGNFITQFSETSDVLQNENYRLNIPLEAGEYNIVAYGGLACTHARFTFTPDFNSDVEQSLTRDDIRVTLPRNAQAQSDKQLHDIAERSGGLFYGALNLTLADDDLAHNYKEETVYMMKDTNNIQVILQDLDEPDKINTRDFDYYIIDDNFVLDGYNNVIEIANNDYHPVYVPYAEENRIMGYTEPGVSNGSQVEPNEQIPVQVACAEFSTSRLFIQHLPTARLVIKSRTRQDKNGNDETVIDIPLIKYLTAIRGFGDNWIKSDQEFLDRQSRWTLMFFLQHGLWVNALISVNWWTVRINDAELE